MKKRLTLCSLVLAAATTLLAHPAADPVLAAPKLTEIQSLQLKNALLRFELARVRAQAAQSDLEQAGAAATALVQSLQVAGYGLDVDRMVYVAKPSPDAGAPTGETPK